MVGNGAVKGVWMASGKSPKISAACILEKCHRDSIPIVQLAAGAAGTLTVFTGVYVARWN